MIILNKNYVLLFLINFMILFSISLRSQESEKAIIDSSKEFGIKLSQKAQDTIGIQTIQLDVSSKLTIPKSSIIYSRDKVGVYRLRQGWFKFIPIQILSRSLHSFLIVSNDLASGDKLVTQGVALLRVSEMEAFASED